METESIRPVLLGESVIPYRILPPHEAVLPLYGDDLMDSSDPRLEEYEGLAGWWADAEQTWNENRSSDRLTLRERLDFRRGLSDQLPAAHIRIVYAKAGMHVAAAVVTAANAIIDHTLYWGSVNSQAEELYVCAILNCPELPQLVRPFMSYGKDERHIDKHVWKLPIPVYNPANETHKRLSELGTVAPRRAATSTSRSRAVNGEGPSASVAAASAGSTTARRLRPAGSRLRAAPAARP